MSYFDRNGINHSFFTMVNKPKEERLAWLQNTRDSLLQEGQTRIQEQRNNLIGYLGAENELQSNPRFSGAVRNRRFRRFKVNHIADIVETKISNLTRLKSAVRCVPAHPEWSDKSAAKVANYVLKNVFENNKLDSKMINIQRQKLIFGESYLFIEWDKNAGGLHPDYVAAKKMGLKQLPLPDGTMLNLKKPVYVGDVVHKIELPWRVFLQRKETVGDVDYCFRVSIIEKDKLEHKYPEAKDISEEFYGAIAFNINMLEEEFMENSIAVWEFFHRHTEELESGYYVKFAGNKILEESDLPYEHGKLPFVRLTDVDAPGYINGVPKFSNGLAVQNRYDDIGTILLKNAMLVGQTKYAVPKGAVNKDDLANENTIVEWVGGPPQPMTVQASSTDLYRFRPEILQELQTIMGSSGVNIANLPTGIRSGTAISLLDERENNRGNSDITKTSDFVIAAAQMSLQVANQYYLPTDQRMIKIVGEDNKYLLRYFDTADLSKPVDIIFENSTGFPESSAARRDRVLEALQYGKEVFSQERWMELLDLNSDEKMVKYATVAINNADSENEDLLAGRPVKDPEIFEDLITKWQSRYTLMQNRSFKDESPAEVYEAVIDNMQKIEDLMVSKIPASPLFEARVATLINFPCLPRLDYTPARSMEQQQAVVQGQANRDGMITGQIPSEEME